MFRMLLIFKLGNFLIGLVTCFLVWLLYVNLAAGICIMSVIIGFALCFVFFVACCSKVCVFVRPKFLPFLAPHGPKAVEISQSSWGLNFDLKFLEHLLIWHAQVMCLSEFLLYWITYLDGCVQHSCYIQSLPPHSGMSPVETQKINKFPHDEEIQYCGALLPVYNFFSSFAWVYSCSVLIALLHFRQTRDTSKTKESSTDKHVVGVQAVHTTMGREATRGAVVSNLLRPCKPGNKDKRPESNGST